MGKGGQLVKTSQGFEESRLSVREFSLSDFFFFWINEWDKQKGTKRTPVKEAAAFVSDPAPLGVSLRDAPALHRGHAVPELFHDGHFSFFFPKEEVGLRTVTLNGADSYDNVLTATGQGDTKGFFIILLFFIHFCKKFRKNQRKVQVEDFKTL